MRRLFILYVFILMPFSSFSQNLVPNGDFETYSTCPVQSTSVQNNEVAKCTGWWMPTDGSPDYYNACATIIVVDVPQNVAGYQQDGSSGQAYMGIFAYSIPGDYREYISAAIAPLQVGKKYKVSMKVSLSGDYSIFNLAVNGFGALFNVDSVKTHSLTGIITTPQIDYTSYGVISDSVNWITMVDTFIADSAYKYITIGNFLDSAMMQKNKLVAGSNQGYYYIDDVEVIDISPTSVNRIASVANTNLSPNPFSNYTTLTFDNHLRKKHTLAIYNTQGILVQKIKSINSGEVKIERGELSPGCYFYELKSEDGAVAKGKLFVQ